MEPGAPAAGDPRSDASPRIDESEEQATERWTLGDLFWLSVPVLAVLGVAAYFVFGIMLGAIPPFTVIDGQSMRPTYKPGDFLVIRGVADQEIEVGDIVAVRPPDAQIEQKGLPGEVVHRVVKITRSDGQTSIITQGDNNPAEDPFISFPSTVRGEVIARVPGAGYPVLFFRSQQGRIFLAALGLAIIGYFIIAAIEKRQEAAELENPRYAIAELTAETHELRELLANGDGGAAAGQPARLDPDDVEALKAETHEVRDTVKELVGAVGEYGEHLRSHTAVLQGMSLASTDLAEVVGQLRDVIGGGSTPLGPPVATRSVATPTPARLEPSPIEPAAVGTYLLAWLRGAAYQEWSLVVVDEVAERLGVDSDDLRLKLIRLALDGRLELRLVAPPDLYRYRLASET